MVVYENCGQKFLFNIKAELYDKLQSQDMKFYSNHRTGDLMTRLTGDFQIFFIKFFYFIGFLCKCLYDTISLNIFLCIAVE